MSETPMLGGRMEYGDFAAYLERVRAAPAGSLSEADATERDRLRYNRQATQWEPGSYGTQLTGTTYAYCPGCGRIMAAYGKNGRVRPHWHTDDFGGAHQTNVDCPGSKTLGEVVEGPVYVSPVDSLKWVRVQ